MNRYPHNPLAPVFAFGAVLATVVTMAIAIVLPATMNVQPGTDAAVLAKYTPKPAEVTVEIERIEVVAAPSAAAHDRAASVVVPALVATKEPG
jgi:hypothetical protein